MSLAEELLNRAVEITTEHSHPVTDSDTYYIVDPITRKVENRASKKNTIMQRDHNSERLTFECPRIIEGHDMSLCNATKIHYVNIDAVTKEERVGVYEVEDISVNPDDEDTVICTWLISRNATQLAGPLQFWIQYACIMNDDVVYEWYTDANEDITIKKTRNNGEAIVEEYPDVLDQWKNDVYGELATAVKSVNDIRPDENGNVTIEVQAEFNESEALILAYEMGLVDPITDENGAILTDENSAILTL